LQYRFWLTSIVGGSILVSLAARGYYAADLDLANSESQVKKLMAARPPGAVGANPKGYVRSFSLPASQADGSVGAERRSSWAG
jgi:hypothetical protein